MIHSLSIDCKIVYIAMNLINIEVTFYIVVVRVWINLWCASNMNSKCIQVMQEFAWTVQHNQYGCIIIVSWVMSIEVCCFGTRIYLIWNEMCLSSEEKRQTTTYFVEFETFQIWICLLTSNRWSCRLFIHKRKKNHHKISWL